MKKLATILFAAVLSMTGAYAQVLFNPDFTSGLPSGYSETTTTTPPGTVTTDESGLTVADFSQNGSTYVSSTVSTVGSNSIASTFTFTPTYTLQGNGGGQANIQVFGIYTDASPTAIFSVVLQPFTYSGTDNLIFNAGVQYNSNQTSTGNGYFSSSNGAPPLGSLSTHALTVNNVTTSTDLGLNIGSDFPVGGHRWMIEDQGAVYEDGSSTPLFSYDVTRTEDTTNGFNPITGALTLELGITNASSDVASASNPDQSQTYFAPGASINYSSVNVSAVPEPSTWALMLGGLGLLVFFQRRARRS